MGARLERRAGIPQLIGIKIDSLPRVMPIIAMVQAPLSVALASISGLASGPLPSILPLHQMLVE